MVWGYPPKLCSQNATIQEFIYCDWMLCMNLQEYFPVLLFIIVASGIGLALLLVGRVLGPNRPDAEKLSPYERGFEAFGDSRMKCDIGYYLIAILSIMFHLAIDLRFP